MFANEFQKPDLPLADLSQRVQDFIKAHMDEESTRGTYPNTNFKEEQTTAEKLNPRAAQHIILTFKEELITSRKLDPEATEFTSLEVLFHLSLSNTWNLIFSLSLDKNS